MAYVTKLRFRSGDRAALDDLLSELKAFVERKGAECKGPHQSPPETLRVPQYARLAPGREFDPWSYTVYTRRMEIHGNEDIARQVAEHEMPDSVHLEVEISRKRPLGRGNEGG